MPFKYRQGKPARYVAAGSIGAVGVDSTAVLLAEDPTVAAAGSNHQRSSGYADGSQRYFAVAVDATAVVVVDHPNRAVAGLG